MANQMGKGEKERFSDLPQDESHGKIRDAF